ncbi:MAG: chemotaxis protein CheA [Planctomycetaceae bacterium]|nr:chemotaxis protein CheA [Planctomycetaceae bacterium]
MPDNSAPDMSGIDPALLQDFISESQEILDGLDPLFVALESNPDDMSIVDGIFRPVHSVKGNSGFFNLTNIKNFAHIMENILGEIRARKRSATPPLIDLLLKGVDFLRGMMNRLAQGDYSGRFTPEEEAHLTLLNEASAGSSGGGAAPDSPEAAAAKALAAVEAVKSGEANGEAAAALEEAVKQLIRITLPDYFASQNSGEEVSIGYMLGGEEITGYVNTIAAFIAKLESNEKEEALCEAFLTGLQTIEDIGEKHKKEIVGLVEQIKDDFITIHESGIGFDELMTSLIQERFDAILEHIDKVEIGGDGDFLLGGENVTAIIKEMHSFITKIKDLEKDSGPSDAFVENIDKLLALAGDNADVKSALDQIRDDFVTIHESNIGFDDLMQSLIEERLTTVLAHLDRGVAVQMSYKLGEADITDIVTSLKAIADDPTRLEDDKTRGAFIHNLQTIGEAAENAGQGDMGTEAAGLVADIENIIKSEVGLDPNMESMISERIAKLLEGRIEEVEVVPEAPAAPEEDHPAPPPGADTQAMAPIKDGQQAKGGQEVSGKTLRVAEEKVDHFMSFVGELIITGEVFAYIQKKLEQYPEVRKVAQEFKNANLSFGELSTNLQKSLMEVRRVPLKSVLQKLHRIIRDTSAALGKKIEFEIEGEDVQIDKSLLEGLESPLVHMVRNSVDHGVETPDDRVAAGKPETGHVWIKASATEEQFTLSITDDGKGLDIETIKAKAVSRNLISEDQARIMPDKEAYRLIFNAGLSTAKVVTDVSGRGVGMDVVLSNITKMNGNITVDSQKGKGSVFTILLPMTVTLTVIDGLVARIGDQFYIIPLSDVRESVKPAVDQVHIIKGSQEVLNVRGELHPIVRLNQILGIHANVTESVTEATAVLVQGKRGKSAAFLVDELIGQQSVVVKDLGKEFESIRCLQGGSILGDGRIGLVLSVQGVLEDIGLAQPET